MNKEYLVTYGNAVILSDKHLREAKYRSTLETELNLENYIEVLNQVIKDKNKDLERLT